MKEKFDDESERYYLCHTAHQEHRLSTLLLWFMSPENRNLYEIENKTKIEPCKSIPSAYYI